jgi:uncharacterized protein RhaS with RHS repeats
VRVAGAEKSRDSYYTPPIGRFISEDPIGFDAGDTNLYRYVGNNSIKLNDPSGLDARVLFQFGHFLIEVDNPNNTSKTTTIDLGPSSSTSFANNLIAGFTGGSVPGVVRITRSKAVGAVVFSNHTLSAEEDQALIRRARMLQRSFKDGDLNFNPIGTGSDGSTNCAGFVIDLLGD